MKEFSCFRSRYSVSTSRILCAKTGGGGSYCIEFPAKSRDEPKLGVGNMRGVQCGLG